MAHSFCQHLAQKSFSPLSCDIKVLGKSFNPDKPLSSVGSSIAISYLDIKFKLFWQQRIFSTCTYREHKVEMLAPIGHSLKSDRSIIYRGYCTGAKGYEFYVLVARTISHEWVQWRSEILLLPREHKIHVFGLTCNVLFNIWTNNHPNTMMTSSISSVVRIWKIRHSGPGAVWYEYHEWCIFQQNTCVYIIKHIRSIHVQNCTFRTK